MKLPKIIAKLKVTIINDRSLIFFCYQLVPVSTWLLYNFFLGPPKLPVSILFVLTGDHFFWDHPKLPASIPCVLTGNSFFKVDHHGVLNGIHVRYRQVSPPCTDRNTTANGGWYVPFSVFNVYNFTLIAIKTKA